MRKKVGNKPAYKVKGKGKKKRARKKNRIWFPKPNVQIWLMRMREKQKKLYNYIQLAENFVLSVGNLFLSHSRASWLKNGSKRGIWSKMRFYSPKFCWLQRVMFLVTNSSATDEVSGERIYCLFEL